MMEAYERLLRAIKSEEDNIIKEFEKQGSIKTCKIDFVYDAIFDFYTIKIEIKPPQENPFYYNEKFEIGGRKNGKRIARLLEFDDNIRQGKFPILVLTNPKPAVVISLEEYKTLIKCRDTLHLAQINKLMNRGGK